MITSTKRTKEKKMFLLDQAGGTEEEQLELDLTVEELSNFDLESITLTANQAG